jgi:carbon-monoxide dehydrogenase large subunit
VTTTFADYLLPMATDVPTCKIVHIESPSPLNPLGVKGAGEGGTIPAAAAIIAAIENALTEFGVHFAETPLMPDRIVEALKRNGAYEKMGAAAFRATGMSTPTAGLPTEAPLVSAHRVLA